MEMCYNNAWGTICGDSGWNYNAAEVVCDQLGFGKAYLKSHDCMDASALRVTTPTSCCTLLHLAGSPSSYHGTAVHGQGAGNILLSGLHCSGYESTLLNCGHGNSVIGITSCSHNQDASVRCSSSTSQPTSMLLCCKG